MPHRAGAAVRLVGLVGAISCLFWALPQSGHVGGGLSSAAVAPRRVPAAPPRTPPRMSAAAARAVRRVPAATPSAPTYRFTTVRFPGSVGSLVTGINASGAYTGQVVRKATTLNFVDSGRPGARPFFLAPPAAYGAEAQTAGIDNAGEVVGNYTDSQGVVHGFIRSPNRRYTSVNIPGAGTQKGEGTEITGLSPGGVIVGSFVAPDKVATGFIDRRGSITLVAQPLAGDLAGEGTAVEFFYHGEYGGIFVEQGRSAHGWYEKNGTVHIVNDPVTGRSQGTRGTQIIGVDARGRLYGIESPDQGSEESFSLLGGVFHVIRDPQQGRGGAGSTLVLGVSPSGVLGGFYTGAGFKYGFIGRPR